MKAAYNLLKRARAICENPKETGMTVAEMAAESGVPDSTLRRLLRKETTHKTLDMMAKFEPVVERVEKELKSKNAKSD